MRKGSRKMKGEQEIKWRTGMRTASRKAEGEHER
jgi:hypothetical protein